MNTLLWIAQAVVAAMFTAGGLLKMIIPKEKMIDKQPYVKRFSSTQFWVQLVSLSRSLLEFCQYSHRWQLRACA
jgi:uncharacterized membrane protein YraQ (UPF0718 family)